jgi:hypothetical protein
LSGDFSLKASFIDRWGRKVEGQEPKTIHFANRIKLREELKIKKQLEAIIFFDPEAKGSFFLSISPYMGSGTLEGDISASDVSEKKFSGDAKVMGVISNLRYYRLPTWIMGFDIFSGGTTDKVSSSEIGLGKEIFYSLSTNQLRRLSLSIWGSYVSTSAQSQFTSNSDSVATNTSAASGYLSGRMAYHFKTQKFSGETYLILGVNPDYLRYSASQALLYNLGKKTGLGPFVEFNQFENGSKEGSIRAKLLKLGLNLHLFL